jgi:hypothetical protein
MSNHQKSGYASQFTRPRLLGSQQSDLTVAPSKDSIQLQGPKLSLNFLVPFFTFLPNEIIAFLGVSERGFAPGPWFGVNFSLS